MCKWVIQLEGHQWARTGSNTQSMSLTRGHLACVYAHLRHADREGMMQRQRETSDEIEALWFSLGGINAGLLPCCCGGLETNFLKQELYKLLWGLETWLSSYEWMLPLQRTSVQLSAPISAHQPPVTSAQEHLTSLASLETCTHTYIVTHRYTHTLK